MNSDLISAPLRRHHLILLPPPFGRCIIFHTPLTSPSPPPDFGTREQTDSPALPGSLTQPTLQLPQLPIRDTGARILVNTTLSDSPTLHPLGLHHRTLTSSLPHLACVWQPQPTSDDTRKPKTRTSWCNHHLPNPLHCRHRARIAHPYFSGELDEDIDEFLQEYEELADKCQLTEEEKVKKVIRYIAKTHKDFWRAMDRYKTNDWEDLCEDLRASYLSTTGRRPALPPTSFRTSCATRQGCR